MSRVPSSHQELKVHIIAARDLRDADYDYGYGNKSDPYVKLKLVTHTGYEKFNRKFGQTSVIDDSLNPVWNQTFHLPKTAIKHDLSYFICEVWDRDEMSDDLLGSCRVYFEYANIDHPYRDAWHSLSKPNPAQGAIHIRLEWCGQNRGEEPRIDHRSSFGRLLDLCPRNAYPSFYSLVNSNIFPGALESVYELVEEACFGDTVGSLYCTQFRVVFCPYNDESASFLDDDASNDSSIGGRPRGNPIVVWLGSIYKVTTDLEVSSAVNDADGSMGRYRRSSDKRKNKTIKSIIIYCKDVQLFQFDIQKRNLEEHKNGGHHISREFRRRESLALDPLVWVTAICASAQRFVEEVEWQIHERGWSTEVQEGVQGRPQNSDLTKHRFDPCREKYIEKNVTVVFAVVPKLSEDYMYHTLKNDFDRQGIDGSDKWKLTLHNEDFKLCPSYTRHLVFPKGLSLATLRDCAKFRSKSRLPALTWLNPVNNAPLCRCAQPLTGMTGTHSSADRAMLTAIKASVGQNSKVLQIFDCRPWKNAKSNALIGKGTENTKDLGGKTVVNLQYLDIGNIHVQRASWQSLFGACKRSMEKATTNFYSNIGQSGWLMNVQSIIVGADKVAEALNDGFPCIVHCSDGWDRTSQVSATAQLLLDPYYRTIRGFGDLISKDFAAFGFQFQKRGDGAVGKTFEKGESSPIFWQWLEVVYHLNRQFPSHFEFNEEFLLFLMNHVYSGIFGNFMFDTEENRDQIKMKGVVHADVWEFVASNRSMFENIDYAADKKYKVKRLCPSKHPSSICFWKKLYLKSMHNAPILSTLAYKRGLECSIANDERRLQTLKRQLAAFAGGDVSPPKHENDGLLIHNDAVLNIRRRLVKRFADTKNSLSEIMPIGCKLRITVPFVQVTKDKANDRKFAQYLVEVEQIEPTENRWGVYRRVSEFYELNDYLEGNGIVMSVHLPNKTWIHKFNRDFLEDRKKCLNEYCKVLGEQSDLFSSPKHFETLKSFLVEGIDT